MGAYGAYPYAYSGLHYGYAGYPYAYHYGKRSADAEPEADADAFYGYYGYARPMVTDTDTEATEATTGDKFLAIQSKSSTTRTSLLVNLTFHPSVRLFGGVGI